MSDESKKPPKDNGVVSLPKGVKAVIDRTGVVVRPGFGSTQLSRDEEDSHASKRATKLLMW